MQREQEITNLDRLKEEAANPFRTLRLFVYGAAGANAAVGGFTSLAQLAGSVGGAPKALPLDQVLQNIGVDFGVVAAAALLYNFDNQNKEKQVEAIAGRDATAAARTRNVLSKDDMAAREATLKALSVDIVVNEAGEKRPATVSEAMTGARQHVVFVAGEGAWVVKGRRGATTPRQH